MLETTREITAEVDEVLLERIGSLKIVLSQAQELIEEILGTCAINIDFEVARQVYQLVSVPRKSKTYYYHRSVLVNDGKLVQRRWFGSVGLRDSLKNLENWLKERGYSRRYLKVLKSVRRIRRSLNNCSKKLDLIEVDLNARIKVW